MRLHTGNPDSEKSYKWTAGFPAEVPLPAPVMQFLTETIFPHYNALFDNEINKEVIEKLLENIRDLADEMGPASFTNNIEMVMTNLEKLLEKKAYCQNRMKEGADEMGEDSEEEKDSQEEPDSEDMDHDEIILGNTTDVIISLSKAMGDSFLPYLARLGPTLVKYLDDEHPKSDKVMVIGCLAEVFNNC